MGRRFGRAEELECSPLFPSNSQLWSARRASCRSSVSTEHHHSGHLDVASKWLLEAKHSSQERYKRVLFGVAAATKTTVGLFKQQWKRLSSVAEGGEGGKEKWSPAMNTMSMTPCALQRLMAAVWLKISLKPLVIAGTSLGCSSGFQL